MTPPARWPGGARMNPWAMAAVIAPCGGGGVRHRLRRAVTHGGHEMRTLAAVAVVLALVGQAWADCGWLMWDSYSTELRKDRAIAAAFETKQACEAAITTH